MHELPGKQLIWTSNLSLTHACLWLELNLGLKHWSSCLWQDAILWLQCTFFCQVLKTLFWKMATANLCFLWKFGSWIFRSFGKNECAPLLHLQRRNWKQIILKTSLVKYWYAAMSDFSSNTLRFTVASLYKWTGLVLSGVRRVKPWLSEPIWS